jgi:hypothetical protein
VPEFVAEWIEILKTKGLKPLKNPETYGENWLYRRKTTKYCILDF